MDKYECGFCGKRYNSIKERMVCESNCSSEREKSKALEEELSMANNELAILRNRESHLVSDLQNTREKVTKAEKKIADIIQKDKSKCGENCKKETSSDKSIYEVDGARVSEREFYSQLDKIFKNLF